MELFTTGDVVRVLDDIAKVHDLQENYGGWVDDMALVSDIHTSPEFSLGFCDGTTFFFTIHVT